MQQRFDVAAHRIQVLTLVHQVAVGLRHRLLDARLLAGQHQFLQFAMRRQQHVGGGRFEGDPALGTDDGIAQVNAAADAEGAGERFRALR